MKRYETLTGSAYAVAAMLVIIPFFDAITSSLPAHFGSEQWRFGVIGLLSNAFMIPAVGLLVAFAIAMVRGHRRVLRVLGWCCGLAAATTTALLFLFALDAIQTRLNVQPAAQFAFAFASFTAAGKLLFAILTLALMSRTGLHARVEPQRASSAATVTPTLTSRLMVSI